MGRCGYVLISGWSTKIENNVYLFHWIEDQLQAMAGAKWFTTLDLTKGYHQIKITRRVQGDHCISYAQRTVSVESLSNGDEDVRGGVSMTNQLNCREISATLCSSVY